MTIRSIGRILFALAVLVIGFGASATAHGTPVTADSIPANLVPPPTSVLVFELHAKGDQIYTCEADPDTTGKFVWTLKAPDAELFNRWGDKVGIHFAGPTWQGLDGSAVVGQVVERSDSPDAGSIPWLLLAAKDHAGTGVFSTVTHVLRLETIGGSAPADGCDQTHQGEENRVPYEATYAFYYPATSTAAVGTSTPETN